MSQAQKWVEITAESYDNLNRTNVFSLETALIIFFLEAAWCTRLQLIQSEILNLLPWPEKQRSREGLTEVGVASAGDGRGFSRHLATSQL